MEKSRLVGVVMLGKNNRWESRSLLISRLRCEIIVRLWRMRVDTVRSIIQDTVTISREWHQQDLFISFTP